MSRLGLNTDIHKKYSKCNLYGTATLNSTTCVMVQERKQDRSGN